MSTLGIIKLLRSKFFLTSTARCYAKSRLGRSDLIKDICISPALHPRCLRHTAFGVVGFTLRLASKDISQEVGDHFSGTERLSALSCDKLTLIRVTSRDHKSQSLQSARYDRSMRCTILESAQAHFANHSFLLHVSFIFLQSTFYTMALDLRHNFPYPHRILPEVRGLRRHRRIFIQGIVNFTRYHGSKTPPKPMS